MSSDIPGDCFLIEQKDLFSQLINQTEDNPDEVDLEAVIQKMKDTEEIKIKVPG